MHPQVIMAKQTHHVILFTVAFSISQKMGKMLGWKVKAKDMNHLDKIIVDKLRGIPDILLTATMLIAKEYK